MNRNRDAAVASPEDETTPGVKCPACAHSHSHSTAVSFRQGLRGMNVWRFCSACKSFFDSDRYDAYEEVLHAQKTAWGKVHRGKELNTFKLTMFRSVLNILVKQCPPPATLLDAGCGYGGFLRETRKRGYNAFGFDMLPEAVEYVRTLGIPAERAFSIGDVKSIEDGSLHLLTCLDCNCYWPNHP